MQPRLADAPASRPGQHVNGSIRLRVGRAKTGSRDQASRTATKLSRPGCGGNWDEPNDLVRRYREVGITHVVFQPTLYPSGTKQYEVLFADFRNRYAANVQVIQGLCLLPVPESPLPPERTPYRVLLSGVDGYLGGVYEVTQLDALETMPPTFQHYQAPQVPVAGGEATMHLQSVNAVVLGRGDQPLRNEVALTNHFHVVSAYPAFSVWIRN